MPPKRRKKNLNPPIELDRQTQRLTRGRNRQIKATFPMLQLPGELREMIYRAYFCFDSVIASIDDHVWHYEDSFCERDEFGHASMDQRHRDYLTVLHKIRTPTILVLNKQVHEEAQAVMRRSSILHITGITRPLVIGLQFFISPAMLRNLTAIRMDDRELNSLIASRTCGSLMCSIKMWLDYAAYLRELADVLDVCHNLASFTFEITHRRVLDALKVPITDPWVKTALTAALQPISTLRGIKQVKFIGCPDDLASQYAQMMQRPPRRFLLLPKKIRKTIYEHCLAQDLEEPLSMLQEHCGTWTTGFDPFDTQSWPLDCLKRNTSILEHTERACTADLDPQSRRQHSESTSSLALLLVNQQIRREVLEVLRCGISAQYTHDPCGMEFLIGPRCDHGLSHFVHPRIWCAISALHLTLPTLQVFVTVPSLLNSFAGTRALKTVLLELEDNWHRSYQNMKRVIRDNYCYIQSMRDFLLDQTLEHQVVWPDAEGEAQMWPAPIVSSHSVDQVEDRARYIEDTLEDFDNKFGRDTVLWQTGLNECLDQDHKGVQCCNRVKRLEPLKLRGLEKLVLEGQWPFCVTQWLESMLEK